mgnify:CR=1 FL=1
MKAIYSHLRYKSSTLVSPIPRLESLVEIGDIIITPRTARESFPQNIHMIIMMIEPVFITIANKMMTHPIFFHTPSFRFIEIGLSDPVVKKLKAHRCIYFNIRCKLQFKFFLNCIATMVTIVTIVTIVTMVKNNLILDYFN